MMLRDSRSARARQVELDDFGRARPDQKQHADIRPAREQPVDDAVEFLVGIGQAGEVALVDDGGREPRLGENHDAGGRLQQVRAGAGADHQEEGILDLAMQPDDAGQAAEDLALAPFPQDRASAHPLAHRRQRSRAAVHSASSRAAGRRVAADGH